MHAILRHDRPDDFVLATGKTITVRSFVECSFRQIGVNLMWSGKGIDEVCAYERECTPCATLRCMHASNSNDLRVCTQVGLDPRNNSVVVRVDPHYYRPTEVDLLLGNPAKAKRVLGWEATTPVDSLCREMVEADLELVAKGDLEN